MSVSVARSVARLGWVLALLVAGGLGSCTSKSTTCAAGQATCGSSCSDLQTDNSNCGACGTTCNIGSTCVAGQCTCPAPSDKVCFGLCVNSQTDVANCGTCGRACGSGTCGGGLCTCTGSSPPIELCPSNPATGTCVDTSSSVLNCGGCGTVCPTGENCVSSTCTCVSPKQLCTSGTTTVCTNTATDPKNCGTCGNACPTGQTCSGGACQLVCSTGLTLCGTSCVDTKTDGNNCGGCGVSCGTGHSCVNGSCQASCSTLVCGSTCCQAPAGGACCTGACPYQHKNFPGTTQEQTYYNCTNPVPTTVDTAQTAASVWSPPSQGGTLISTRSGCPTLSDSLCVIWKRDAINGANAQCGVFCYEGPFAGAAKVTQGTTCACPTTQQIDWY